MSFAQSVIKYRLHCTALLQGGVTVFTSAAVVCKHLYSWMVPKSIKVFKSNENKQQQRHFLPDKVQKTNVLYRERPHDTHALALEATPISHLVNILVSFLHLVTLFIEILTSFSASPEPDSSSNWFTSAFLFCFSTSFFRCSSGVIRT